MPASARHGIRGKNLYAILFYGVIGAAMAIGLLAFWGVREIRHDAASIAVESSGRGVAGAVNVLMSAVSRTDADLGGRELASLEEKYLRTKYQAILKRHQTLTGVAVADAAGLVFSLARGPEGLVEGVRSADGKTMSWRVFREGADVRTLPGNAAERERVNRVLVELFRQLKPGQINWSSAYRIQRGGESWVSASQLLPLKDNESDVMVSYMFPVDVVANQLAHAERGSAESIFLFWNNGKIMEIPLNGDAEIVGERAARAIAPDDAVNPAVSRAAKLLAARRTDRLAPFAFRLDGSIWWADLEPLSVFGDTMSVGVIMPQKAAVSTLTSDNFIAVFSALLALAAGVALFFLHRNRLRIEALGQRQHMPVTAEDVLHLIAEGESSRLEFKQTLRFNVKAGKNGKEIEYASLKTVAGFLNSEGGTLLVGVSDNGAVTGLDDDKFENDDKALLHFNNLLNQSIGAEFARYVNTKVIEVQGSKVLRVFCVPAHSPAFLKKGQAEEFYVRSGPASRTLSLSQFYEWLQNR